MECEVVRSNPPLTLTLTLTLILTLTLTLTLTLALTLTLILSCDVDDSIVPVTGFVPQRVQPRCEFWRSRQERIERLFSKVVVSKDT